MIEEQATVVASEPGFVWVETGSRAVCDACGVRSGCGTGSLSKIFRRRQSAVRVACELDVDAGDKVVIGVSPTALLNSAMLAYLLPIVGLIAGAWLVSDHAGSNATQAIGALLAFLLALLLSRHITRRLARNPGFMPVVLRRDDVVSATSVVFHK